MFDEQGLVKTVINDGCCKELLSSQDNNFNEDANG